MKRKTAEVLFAMGVWSMSLPSCSSTPPPPQNLELSAVPPDVRASLNKQAHDGYITNVRKLVDGDKTTYEAHVVNAGSTSEIRVDDKGKLLGSW